MSDQRGKVLSFGPFELSIGNRLLTNGAKVVPLGARAMDLLIVLVEQANKVVGRRTLIERVIRTNFGNQLRLYGNDALDDLGRKSPRRTQFPLTRDPFEPTSSGHVRLAFA